MTINIAIATYDAIVLGCDSLSSQVEQAYFPLRGGANFARDAEGNELVDAMGNRVISISSLQASVTNVFGGAQKMFCLYEDDDTSVAAVTAGMATLGGLTIAGIANRFRKTTANLKLTYSSVREVAQAFLEHVRAEWEIEVGYKQAPEEVRPYFPDVQFIVGGYGADVAYGQVYKLFVSTLTVEEQFQWKSRSGTCFTGQSDFVERLLVGVDHNVARSVEAAIRQTMARQSEVTAQTVLDELRSQGLAVPELTFEVPDLPLQLPWHENVASIDFGNLPTQYAVDLAELLVNLQSGMQRFATGVATVGGRTHIGVLRRGERFAMLNEPKLVHNHTGYSHDL